MVKGFSTKKVNREKSLGEIFKAARKKKDLSLIESENGSKVRAKFLDAIERSDWKNLPQTVYVRGFVLAYAKYLSLPIDETIKLFEAEAKMRGKESPSEISYNQPIKQKKVFVTPKILAYFVLCCFVVFMFSYIILQVLNFAGNPNLKIVSPENNLVTENDSINLSGFTDTDTSIAVNNESVPVSNDGKFVLDLKLHRGVNVIKVNAVNKARKESSEVYTIEYKPKTAEATSPTSNQ